MEKFSTIQVHSKQPSKADALRASNFCGMEYLEQLLTYFVLAMMGIGLQNPQSTTSVLEDIGLLRPGLDSRTDRNRDQALLMTGVVEINSRPHNVSPKIEAGKVGQFHPIRRLSERGDRRQGHLGAEMGCSLTLS